MSLFAFMGAIEIGLVFGLVGIGVFITFRVLDFPDLTVDGSFPMGAAATAAAIVAGVDPWLATGLGILAGAACGLVTGFLAIRCGILHLLAGILTMIAAFSVNIRIMGRPNVPLLGEPTILDPLAFVPLNAMYARPLFVGIIVGLCALALIRFLKSDFGLAMRSTGVNPRMTRANGVNTGLMTYVGLAISNGLVALAGALFAQTNGFADVTSGLGTIVIGLAAVILGETLFRSRSLAVTVFSCIAGSLIYRLAIFFALSSDLGLEASDINLVTAVVVALALIVPKFRDGRALARARSNAA